MNADDVRLTEDETAALSEILAALATMEQRAKHHPKQLVEVSREMWADMLLRPAVRLRRVTTRRLDR